MTLHGPSTVRTRAARVAWQTPIAAALLVLALAAFGARVELLPVAYLALVTPELCRVDVSEYRLPNAIVLPGLALAAVAPLLGWAATGAPPAVPYLAGVATAGSLLGMHVAGGLGMGDVKLGTALGLSLGCLGAVVALSGPVLAFLAGGAAALIALAAPSLAWGRMLPFGPFLILGYWAAIALALAA
jgi:Type II secretory pathway, prepilin signal peptidase PulO and related peptidases